VASPSHWKQRRRSIKEEEEEEDDDLPRRVDRRDLEMLSETHFLFS
jgi:hypothetical protein